MADIETREKKILKLIKPERFKSSIYDIAWKVWKNEMQGEKKMKGKVLTPTEWKVSTPTLCWKGSGQTDWRMDGLSDQGTRLQEFHMVYGTKNVRCDCEELIDLFFSLNLAQPGYYIANLASASIWPPLSALLSIKGENGQKNF